MKLHLFFLNLAACFVLLLGTPLALRDSYEFSRMRLEELARAGAADLPAMIAYAKAHDSEALAEKMVRDDYLLVNWLTTFRSIRNYLIIPCFMIVMVNAALLLKLHIKDAQGKNEKGAA